MKPHKSNTKPYLLMEQIRERIVQGIYRPGAPLREQELASDFEASRGPVREALRILELSGLVTHLPRRGFRVTLYSEKEIRDLYALRALLEGRAVAELLDMDGCDTANLCARLEASNEDMRRAQEICDVSGYLAGNIRFHETILLQANNRPLMSSITRLNEIAEPLRYIVLARDITRSRAVESHEAIVVEIRAGRIQQASRLMSRHIQLSLPSILKIYNQIAYGPGED